MPIRKERKADNISNQAYGVRSIYGSNFNSNRKSDPPNITQYKVRWLNQFLNRNFPSKIPRKIITAISNKDI
jgi:hypothetical protein